jgi:hypothetical protein
MPFDLPMTRSPDQPILYRCHQWYDFSIVSRKPAFIKVVNLEEGMPTVDRARLRMEHELQVARQAGYKAVKLVHGYGSSGVGGALRTELQKELRQAASTGTIRALIAGEDWRIADETTWELLKRFPEWKQDSDLGRTNRGISIVIL